MKTYKITDDFLITRYGNRLRFDLFNYKTDDIDGDDVAKILDTLAAMDLGESSSFWRKKTSYENYNINLQYVQSTSDEPDLMRISICDEDMTVIPDSTIDLSDRSIRFKLGTVLSHLLPKVCQENI